MSHRQPGLDRFIIQDNFVFTYEDGMDKKRTKNKAIVMMRGESRLSEHV